jgi:hypothetical protein
MFSLKEARDSQSRFSVSAVSYRFQRCHWHRWNFRNDPHSCFRGVIDTAETISAVSLTPLNFGKKNFCGWNPYDVLNFTIMVVSAVSLIPLKPFQRCHWHRWNSNNVDFLGEYQAICETVLACQWHRWNGFSGVIDTAETRIMSIFLANTKPYAKRV